MTSPEKQTNCMPLATAGLPTLPCFTASEKVGFLGSADFGIWLSWCWLLKCCWKESIAWIHHWQAWQAVDFSKAKSQFPPRIDLLLELDMEPHLKTTPFSMVEGGALNKLFDLLDERMLELPEIAEMLELLSNENSYLVWSQPDPSRAPTLSIVGEDSESISMGPSRVPNSFGIDYFILFRDIWGMVSTGT